MKIIKEQLDINEFRLGFGKNGNIFYPDNYLFAKVLYYHRHCQLSIQIDESFIMIINLIDGDNQNQNQNQNQTGENSNNNNNKSNSNSNNNNNNNQNNRSK